MKRASCLLVFGALLMGAEVNGAETASPSGIIKGTITATSLPTGDVVVSLEGLPQEHLKSQSSNLKAKKAVMDQREMKFIPRVLPVLAGTTVEFPNHDTSWHNVYSKSEAKDFDLGLYPPGKMRSATFDKAGVVRILCNVHPAMEGFIVVMEHPFFSGADRRGNYRIDGVPLGKYRLRVWHPQFGTSETEVQLIREGQVLDVDFDLKRK